MYYYILGCGIACLVLFGIYSMETVCVKPAEMVGNTSEDVEKAIKAAVLFAGTAAFLLYTRGPDVVHCIL